MGMRRIKIFIVGLWALGCVFAGAATWAATLDLAGAERDWLREHATDVRVGVIEIPPLVMQDNTSGAYEGMAIDFLRRFDESLGIKTKVVRYPNWKALLDASKAKEVDLVLTTVNTPERRAFLNFPPPYVTLKNVIIGRQSDTDEGVNLAQLAGKRVAVLEASAVHERIVKEFPQIRVYPLREERALLSAVAFYEADFAVTELSRAVWWMQHDKLSSLRVVGQTPFDYALSVAVRNDWPHMVSALTKASTALSKEDVSGIMRQWAYTDVEPWVQRSGFWGKVLWGGALGGVVLLVAVGFIIFLRRKVATGTAALQKQLEQSDQMRLRLMDSERKFRELAELTSDIFWETNDRLIFVRYYGGGTSLVGWSESDLLGKSWWDLPLAGLEPGAMDQLIGSMARHQSFRRWVCRIVVGGGAQRWLSLNGQAILDDQGNFLGYRGTGQDVTDRMLQQGRLSEALERLQAIQDGTYSFLGLLSPEGRMLECNRSALDFVGRTRSEVIGKVYWDTPWWGFPDEISRLQEGIKAAAKGNLVKFDARVLDAAGSTHWVDFSLSPYYDERGELVYLVTEGHDITEAKQAATALDNMMSSTGAVYGEDYFRKVVEAMGRLLAVKTVFIGRLSGNGQGVHTKAVWSGNGFADNFNYDLLATPCANVMSNGCCVYPRDVQGLFPDDVLLQQMGIESYAGMPILGGSGRPVGILAVLHDKPLIDSASMRRLMELFAVRAATEFDRVDFETEIRSLNTGLESRVAERTEALQQANRELEAFSYSVSHDLRAPLRHISGFVEMLVEEAGESLSSEGKRYLEVISQSANRMGVMIDDLLAFSRAGRSEVRKTRLELRPMVEECIQRMEQDLLERNIDWQIGDLPEVSADRGLLSLILDNLIGNAVKYSRTRNPATIEIGIAETGNDQEQVVFVRDNGIGFDMKYAHKLFGVFQRLHSDSEYEGTGIGLANVRRIVERHGGRVWAESVENQGSTFYFTLPVLAVKRPVDAEQIKESGEAL